MNQGTEHTVPPGKWPLRRQLRARRRSLLPQRDRDADADAIAATAGTLLDTLSLAQERAGGHSPYDEQPCVAIYRSLPLEPPTEALAKMLHSRHARVIVPETLPDFDLEWHELRSDGSEGPRLGLEGITAAQLILTPALSVDHTGTRLGQGGGCYDRALARRRPGATVVAIVNDEELTAGPLPFDAHDLRVDGVITPGGGFREIAPTGSVA